MAFDGQTDAHAPYAVCCSRCDPQDQSADVIARAVLIEAQGPRKQGLRQQPDRLAEHSRKAPVRTFHDFRGVSACGRSIPVDAGDGDLHFHVIDFTMGCGQPYSCRCEERILQRSNLREQEIILLNEEKLRNRRLLRYACNDILFTSKLENEP